MEPDEPGVRFKAKKRTKTLRQRDRSASPEASTSAAAPTAARDTPPTPADDADGKDAAEGSSSSTMHAALKLRQARTRHRFRGGVPFGRDEPAALDAVDGSAEEMGGLVLRDAPPPPQGLPDRFMHQTGFVADADDKHMMAYVESRLSSRAANAEPAAAPPESKQAQEQQPRQVRAPGTMQTGTSTTSWTKLVEVEVPADLRRSTGAHQHGKKRGRDGGGGGGGVDSKPPPRRRRNRRGSDDVKRDAMVEAFLSENKLDVYDVSSTGGASSSAAAAPVDATRSADDVLAENFRQQYMEEVAARRQRKRPAINQPRVTQKQAAHQQAVAAGEVLKGPKLGGSRNARAAVRDKLLQQQELSKKK